MRALGGGAGDGVGRGGGVGGLFELADRLGGLLGQHVQRRHLVQQLLW